MTHVVVIEISGEKEKIVWNTAKNLVHKGVDFYVQNALKLTYTSVLNSKFFSGVISWIPVEEGGDGRGRDGTEGREKGYVMAVGGWTPLSTTSQTVYRLQSSLPGRRCEVILK